MVWNCAHRPDICPEEKLVACLKSLAYTHTAFQAGWTDEELNWRELRLAALENCGCDSASFENGLRRLMNEKPARLEELLTEAGATVNSPPISQP